MNNTSFDSPCIFPGNRLPIGTVKIPDDLELQQWKTNLLKLLIHLRDILFSLPLLWSVWDLSFLKVCRKKFLSGFLNIATTHYKSDYSVCDRNYADRNVKQIEFVWFYMGILWPTSRAPTG